MVRWADLSEAEQLDLETRFNGAREPIDRRASLQVARARLGVHAGAGAASGAAGARGWLVRTLEALVSKVHLQPCCDE